ncbi:translation initiation factor IF-2 subunit gamma [Thermocladium modestius]|uniref:protein-synthesizing GTPase n=1 Tax=Thermocladium modestius TaxID=62609 RepID=A0A830GVG1_9CREN|nr:translation initiation factor IF-2 subunit gamma [Thermocladium modestius]GGP21124.1 translation initiation factor IF-2 subunit gamma [Thermocladium modestius]
MENYTYPNAILITAGHVDHGKTTVVHALSGAWVARHSEELKRAMTIKLGYTSIDLAKCDGAEFGVAPKYLVEKCPNGDIPKPYRKISMLDAPGHEVLISTMISGVTFVDAIIMIIDATMPVPQPQTEEHFLAASVMGIKNLIIVQNKIDLVQKDKAIENYKQIQSFIKGTWAEGAPIIPVSALHKVNIDALATVIDERVPPKSADMDKSPIMYVLRSFNVNRPGTPAEKLVGGVVGGSLIQGRLRIGDEIEIRPGLKMGNTYKPIITKVVSIAMDNVQLDEARPGGLVAIGTQLDPALTKADSLVGSVVGHPNELYPVYSSVVLDYHQIQRRDVKDQLKTNDQVMTIMGSASIPGIIKSIRNGNVEITLRRAVCASPGSRAVVIKQVGGRWRIIGWGALVDGQAILD